MILAQTYKPTGFFLLSLLLACVAWILAAYASYHTSLQQWLFPLILAGMSSPTISALCMFAQAKDKTIWTDFCQRLHPNKMNVSFIPLVLLFMPCMVMLAIIISLFLGYSPTQFSFSQLSPDQALEGKSFLALLIIFFLSCSLEEIGWRGYGIESLNSKYNLWKTSWIFATLWCFWHIPAFFIKNGYFQQEVWNLGIVYTATYFATLFPVTYLINWAYVKNNRSIIIAILAHASLNLSVALFQIQPVTKIILMILLMIVMAIVVIKDKELFFKKTVKDIDE